MVINNPIVTDSEWLQATAVAIQNKDGGSKMEVSDFASRIEQNLQSKAVLDSVIDRSITSIENSEVTSIGPYAFCSCTSLTSVSFPNATSIKSYAFNSCTKLASVSLPNATSIGGNAFSYSPQLASISLPNATSIEGSAFASCTKLASVSLPNATSIKNYAFNSCTKLASVILGKRATLSNSNAFNNANSAIIYVQPEDLTWYSTATNWSTLYAQNRIKSIEDLTGDDLAWYQEQLARYQAA